MEISELAAELRARAAGRDRLMVAVAGPPAAGKSTVAEALAAAVGAEALVVPMDGFHLDNAVLEARGLLARKGAPETFDAAGFIALIGRLRQEAEVVIPAFDRSRDIAIAGASVVEAGHRILIVEGNYLLLDRAPWEGLAALWDVTVWLEVPIGELEARSVARWLSYGMEEAAAQARARGNDMANARAVIEGSRAADVVIANF
ncbi:MAG: nucleoside/nucleotide kinase family protein [Pseudorhodobacter sp.]